MSLNAAARPARPTGPSRSVGWLPFALVTLVLIPAAAGSARLVELAGGPHLMPANGGITASPAPVIVHIVGAILYAVLGAFQFSSGLRRRAPRWHRVAGRAAVVLGLGVALSGLWMTQFYPHQRGAGDLGYGFRLVFGSGMAASIVLGLAAIRRRDIPDHLAWMTRAYALGLGAGMQVLTLGVGAAVFGPGELTRSLMLGAGWVVNLAVAEVLIRRSRPRGRRTAVVSVGAS